MTTTKLTTSLHQKQWLDLLCIKVMVQDHCIHHAKSKVAKERLVEVAAQSGMEMAKKNGWMNRLIFSVKKALKS